MKITYNAEDKLTVVKALRGAGITSADDKKLDLVLTMVSKAFEQQFEEEVEYMVNEFEADDES